MKFIYKAISLSDLIYIIRDITGISTNKIRKILVNSEYFEFIYKMNTGNAKLIRVKMNEKEQSKFKNDLLKKYSLYKNTLNDDTIEDDEDDE